MISIRLFSDRRASASPAVLLIIALILVSAFGIARWDSSESQRVEVGDRHPKLHLPHDLEVEGAVGDQHLDVMPSFIGLGDLPGGVMASFARGVSRDGTVVVGNSYTSRSQGAFCWTFAEGLTAFEFLKASGVSGAGSEVVGCRLSDGVAEAVVWTVGHGARSLPGLPGCRDFEATAVSADGDVVAGSCLSDGREEAFCWNESDGSMRLLGRLPNGHASVVLAVSADGTVVVGRSNTPTTHEAFRWTEAEGMVGLGVLPGDTSSEARDVSSDGSVVVGCGTHEAFLWSERDGMVSLRAEGDDVYLLTANGVSADAAVVVGTGQTKVGHRACVWDAVHGTRTVREVLQAQSGADDLLGGWKLSAANAISDDGRVVAGWGTNPEGNIEAWVAHLDASSRPSIVQGSEMN